jgi:hypothetical protein
MGRGSSRAWGGGGCGEERERDRGGGAEVYIVFGKIQGASRAQRAARCEAGAAQTTPSELHSGLVFRISFFFLIPAFGYHLFLLEILAVQSPQACGGVDRSSISMQIGIYIIIIRVL